jgi:hypothetical protein
MLATRSAADGLGVEVPTTSQEVAGALDTEWDGCVALASIRNYITNWTT